MSKNLLLGGLAALAILAVTPARADVVNNLTFGLLGALAVPQSQSAPCVICATNTAQNPIGFGYNNFVNTGATDTFNVFSSNITGAFANNDQTTVTPYTGGQLRSFLEGLPNAGLFDLSFGIAIDINTAGGPGGDAHYLDFFQLINLDAPIGSKIIYDIRDIAMPVVDNGNGKADYLLTGFDLSGVNIGDRLLFRAAFHGASDGGESFYIVPQINAVPGPMAGAGVPGLIMALGGLIALNRRRKQRLAVA